MKAQLIQRDAMLFRGTTEAGNEIELDAERKAAPSPMEAALLATMACSASDVVWILRKERVPFTSLEIAADAERARSDPKVFTKIHLRFRVRGHDVSETAVRRAIDLSTERYCSVGIMLRRGGVDFVNTVEILPPE